jgi:hypothetical protein
MAWQAALCAGAWLLAWRKMRPRRAWVLEISLIVAATGLLVWEAYLQAIGG